MMKKIATALFCLAVSAMLVFSVNAQNAAKNWIFGQKARINFNGSTPTVSSVNTINTNEGSSSISDSNGNLLFYTDGITVWDKNNNIMANGTGLLGSASSTTAALIVPCNCNKYFIFTTDDTFNQYANGLRYSIVDMTANSNLGTVTSKNTALLSRAAEKIAAVSDGNGGFWVVAHSMDNNRFLSYHIVAGSDCTSPLRAVVSSVGSMYSGELYGYGPGQMKISPDGRRLAAAGYNPGGNNRTSFIELFQFDINTGAVSNLAAATVRDTLTSGIYGVEFSPDSQALYTTTLNVNNSIYRYNIAGNTLTSRTTIHDFGNAIHQTGGLQLAPDGKIYVARYQKTFLNVLSDPNAASGGWTTTQFNLAAGTVSGEGLPAMVAGNFTCGQQGCCDQVKQTPFWTPDLSLAWKAFEIYNVKYPSSDVCSIDIDIRDSNNQQPPSPWNGGGLKVNGSARAVPTWWKSPYIKIPNGTNGQTTIDGHPNFSSAAVNFNLGLDYSGTYTGKVKFIIRHCDGTICEWVSENWTPKPPTLLPLAIRETYLADLSAPYLPLTLGFREGINVEGEAKWLAVEPMDEDVEVFSVDGGRSGAELDSTETTDEGQLIVVSSRKQDRAALYEFARPVSLERLGGGEVKLVLKRMSGSSIRPRLRFIFFDENANMMGFATNEANGR
jgi:hypothetical protein